MNIYRTLCVLVWKSRELKTDCWKSKRSRGNGFQQTEPGSRLIPLNLHQTINFNQRFPSFFFWILNVSSKYQENISKKLAVCLCNEKRPVARQNSEVGGWCREKTPPRTHTDLIFVSFYTNKYHALTPISYFSVFTVGNISRQLHWLDRWNFKGFQH